MVEIKCELDFIRDARIRWAVLAVAGGWATATAAETIEEAASSERIVESLNDVIDTVINRELMSDDEAREGPPVVEVQPPFGAGKDFVRKLRLLARQIRDKRGLTATDRGELRSAIDTAIRDILLETCVEREIKRRTEEREKDGDDKWFGDRLDDALRQNAPLSVVQAIVRTHPDVLVQTGDDGFIPLMKAMNYGCDPVVVQFLLQETPEDLDRFFNVDFNGDNNRMGPIHMMLIKYPFLRRRLDEGGEQERPNTGETVPEEKYVASLELLEQVVKRYSHHLLTPMCGSSQLRRLAANDSEDERLADYEMEYDRQTHGHLPVHYAVWYQFPYEALKLLVEAKPEALRVEMNMYLHESAGPVAVFREAGIFPVAAGVPLTTACYFRHDYFAPLADDELLRQIQLLVRHCPETLHHKVFHPGCGRSRDSFQLLVDSADAFGWTGISYRKTVRFLLEQMYPEKMQVAQHAGGWLPFHSLIDRYTTIELLPLARLFPDWLAGTDENGCNGLHLLCRAYPGGGLFWDGSTCSENFERIIAELDDDTVRALDDTLQLPLHKLCSYNKSFVVHSFRVLLEKYPEAVRMYDKNDDFPLHLAIKSGQTSEVIQFLIEQWEEGVQKKNNAGDLPLHSAIKSGQPSEVIILLAEQYPAALEIPNDNGELPLHAAIESVQSSEVIEFLIMKSESSVSIPLPRGDDEIWLPFLLAAKNDCELDSIFALVRSTPPDFERLARR